MLRGKKINGSPVLDKALSGSVSLAQQASKVAANASPKISEKVKPIKEMSIWSKCWEKLVVFQAILGFILVIQGCQFKNLLICTQLVRKFLFERMRAPVVECWNAITSAKEQLGKDEGDEPSNEGDEKTEQKSKQAQKREAAKKAGDPGATAKENAAVATKLMKAVTSHQVSEAAAQVLLSVSACAVVIHGGFPQTLLVAHLLAGLIYPIIIDLVEFKEHPDLQSWTELLLSSIAYMTCLTLTFWFPSFALAIYSSALGVQLIADSECLPAKIAGQEPDLTMGLAGTGFGALWQIWTWAQGGGLAWYFSLLYLPAVTAEGLLSLLARLIGGC